MYPQTDLGTVPNRKLQTNIEGGDQGRRGIRWVWPLMPRQSENLWASHIREKPLGMQVSSRSFPLR